MTWGSGNTLGGITGGPCDTWPPKETYIRQMRVIFIHLRKTRRSETCTRKEELSKGQSSLQWKETETHWLWSHKVSSHHSLKVLFLLQELPLRSHGFLGADSFDHSVTFVLNLFSLAICGNFGPLDSSGLCFYLSVLGPIVPRACETGVSLRAEGFA
jgi:hypothetical protein